MFSRTPAYLDYALLPSSAFSIFLGPTISGVVCTCKLTNVQIPYDEEEGWLEGYVRGSIEDSVQTEASEAVSQSYGSVQIYSVLFLSTLFS